MRLIFNKFVIFLVLTLFAIAFFFLAAQSEVTFLHDLWSQLFWLTVSTIATTFVLGSILDLDQKTRYRDADAFAFRTFTSRMLTQLLEISGSSSELKDPLVQSALFEKKKFASTTEAAARAVSSATNFSPSAYQQYYSDIANGLRDLARNYIRLFTSNNNEMVETYNFLQSLAARWIYHDALSEAFGKATQSLDPVNENRHLREEETLHELQIAQETIKDTANYLSQLAQRTAKYRGMPPP